MSNAFFNQVVQIYRDEFADAELNFQGSCVPTDEKGIKCHVEFSNPHKIIFEVLTSPGCTASKIDFLGCAASKIGLPSRFIVGFKVDDTVRSLEENKRSKHYRKVDRVITGIQNLLRSEGDRHNG